MDCRPKLNLKGLRNIFPVKKTLDSFLKVIIKNLNNKIIHQDHQGWSLINVLKRN